MHLGVTLLEVKARMIHPPVSSGQFRRTPITPLLGSLAAHSDTLMASCSINRPYFDAFELDRISARLA